MRCLFACFGRSGLMPWTKKLDNATVAAADFRTKFSHSQETAVAGFYSVQLASGVLVELAPSGTHSALHRYTFAPSTKASIVVIDVW